MMLKRSMGFNSVLLGGFALVTAVVVAVTFQKTAPRIQEARLRAAQEALFEIIPESEVDNDLYADTIPVSPEYLDLLGLESEAPENQVIHIARKNGKAFAAIIPTNSMDGYSGEIKMIVGVNADGTIAGIRVTDHKETPGLGDYVDVRKSNWVLSFDGKSLHSRFDGPTTITSSDGGDGEKKYDQLTGATITRTAVIRQVEKTLTFFQIAQPLAGTKIVDAL